MTASDKLKIKMRSKNKYRKITEARKILKLSECATMKQIKENYKKLIKEWHPDRSRENKEYCEEMAKKINEAYKAILTYCNNYKYSFSKEEVEKYLPIEEWWLKRFGDDPLWGNRSDTE